MPQSERPAREVHTALQEALARMRRAEECAVLHFAEILRRKLYRELGHSSIHAYAEIELGFGPSKTYRFIRLAESLGKLPRLKESLEKKEISWTKACTVARVATKESEKKWLAEAAQSSSRQLEVRVREARARTRSKLEQSELLGDLSHASGGSDSPPSARVQVSFDLIPEQHARFQAMLEGLRKRENRASRTELLLEAFAALGSRSSSRDKTREQPESSRLESEHSVERRSSSRRDTGPPYQIVIYRCEDCGKTRLPDGRAVDEATAAQAACDARVQRTGESNKATIPPSIRRKVLARDGHRCAMPGCSHTRFLEVHHRRPRTEGGTNKPENLITLCSACHRLVHEKPSLLDLLPTKCYKREAACPEGRSDTRSP